MAFRWLEKSSTGPLPNEPSEESLIPEPLDLLSFPSESTLKSQIQRGARQPSSGEYPRTTSKHFLPTCSTNELKEKEPLYNCSLCHFPLSPDSKPRYLPRTHNPFPTDDVNRIYCEDCWIWIYSIAICWTCGEIVGREEEKVGFGWCWWHWGCLSCLVCRVS